VANNRAPARVLNGPGGLDAPLRSSNNRALKEWASVVQAVREGIQTILLRKGGIEEEGGTFRVAHDEFVFFPTYEHQSPDSLAPRYQRFITPYHVDAPTLTIDTYARVLEAHPIHKISHLEPFSHLHVWSPAFVAERFRYRPEEPMWLILFQGFRLDQPVAIPKDPAYAGCRSWVTLKQSIPTASARPILPERRLAEVQQSVRTILSALPPS
jgi:hypothetical protein